MSKRAPQDSGCLSVVADKRPRTDYEADVALLDRSDKGIVLKPKRHSLTGPIMLLTGHDGEIFSAKFNPTGTTIASAGGDRSIFLWSAKGDCENYAILKAAHSNAILDLEYSADGRRLFSCSVDETIIIWDCSTGCRLKKLRKHHSHVNSLSAARKDPNLLVSVGDDSAINVWDLRKKGIALACQENYPLTAVSFNGSGDQIFVGGVENVIKVWDIRKLGCLYKMQGHNDTITGLKVSPDGQHLLSKSMDSSLRSWNIHPSATAYRFEKNFQATQQVCMEYNLLRCSWSPDGSYVTAGSPDRNVYIWNFNTCDLVHKLPGHKGSVNEVVFSPCEPLILSCSSDKQMYLGEIL